MSNERTAIPVTCKNLDSILMHHGLSPGTFEGAAVYDLGCGMSDIGAELAVRGVKATVTGFDQSKRALNTPPKHENSTRRVFARLDDLPAEDESADIVIANYSLPFWGRSAEEIFSFFKECKRVVKEGGLLAINPAATSPFLDTNFAEREAATIAAVREIRESLDWMDINMSSDVLTVTKIP